MSRPGGRRSEDDLRAAFAAKATQAPKAEDVLRAVRRATRPRPSRLRWLLPAVAAAAAVAIAVPIALSVSDSTGGPSRKAPANAAAGGGVDASKEARGAASPSAPAAMSANGVCRPDQVRAAVTVRRDAGVERATLTVTALADCRIARVPRVTWNGATVLAAVPAPTYGDTQHRSGASSEASTDPYGRLAAGATATATIHAADQCSTRSGDTVRVDWGAGEVELHATGVAPRCEAAAQPAKLNIGPFSGLS
ncbi:MAG TPA: hypothetical protein VGJ38_01030 [Jatrophihabitantaceae bacterium]